MITLYTAINMILVFIYWTLIISITLRVIISRRTASSTISWLLIIYIIPLIGIFIYLLFGELNLGKNRYNRSKSLWKYATKWISDLKKYNFIFSRKSSKVARSLFKLCENRQDIIGITGNKIKLITDTNDALLTIINDIYKAKNNIEMIFYIWHMGGIVNKISEALMDAAQRGVNCRIMLDSAGSIKFFRSSYYYLMRAAGISIVEALNISIFRIFIRRMDLRQHRKMILIDKCIAYTGSMNMVDPGIFKKESGIGKWVDIIVRMEGPVTTAMDIIFSCDWEIETGEKVSLHLPNFNIFPLEKKSGYNIQVIPSGPGYLEKVIHQVLLISIYSAQKTLIITTPYLVPSEDLLQAICIAAQRGVKVHIIVPRYIDSILVNWASKYFFSELLESGVLIHQFEEGLLHTKSVLIDNQLSLLGTVNLDMRSLWLNFEITLVIDSNDFGINLAKIQKDYFLKSQVINAKTWSKRPYWQRIIERLFYFFSPLL